MGTEVNIRNNNGGKIVSTALVVLLVIALACAYFCYSKWHDAKVELKASENNKELLVKSINSLQDSSKTLKLKINDQKVSAAEYNTLFIDKKNIENQLSDKLKTIRLLGAKLGNIESVVTQKVTTIDTIHTIAYVDSLQSLYTSYKDSFINISATIYRDRSSTIAYSNNEIFDLLNYRSFKHRFLFAKWGKVDKFVLVPHNKNTRVQIRAIKIIDDQ